MDNGERIWNKFWIETLLEWVGSLALDAWQYRWYVEKPLHKLNNYSND